MMILDDMLIFISLMLVWISIYFITKRSKIKENIHLHDCVYGLIHGISSTIISLICIYFPSPILIKILIFNSVWYYIFNSVLFEQSRMFIAHHVAHHVAAIICYISLCYTDFGFNAMPLVIFIAEITNPLQNIISILSELRSTKMYFAQLIKIHIVTILIVRNIIAPLYMYNIIVQMIHIGHIYTCFIFSFITIIIIIATDLWAYKFVFYYSKVSKCEILLRHI